MGRHRTCRSCGGTESWEEFLDVCPTCRRCDECRREDLSSAVEEAEFADKRGDIRYRHLADDEWRWCDTCMPRVSGSPLLLCGPLEESVYA